MEFKNKESEILDESHKYITNLMISNFSEEEGELFTKIPRNLFNSPYPFVENETYNIVHSGGEKIYLFKVSFAGIAIFNDSAKYKFYVKNFQEVNNVRKEERKSVDKKAVYTDFSTTSVANILDISSSGIRLETEQKIVGEFIDLFFDENNTPRRALGKILWEKIDNERNVFMYGCKLEFRN